MPSSRIEKNTVVVFPLRCGTDNAVELLMTEGRLDACSSQGELAFPRGSIAREDPGEPRLRRCRGLSSAEAQRILGSELKPNVALGHWAGAVRVLYEATGLLLRTEENVSPAGAISGWNGAGIRAKRVSAREKPMDFDSLLIAEGLFCDLSRLAYFSQWAPEDDPSRPIRHFLAFLAPRDGGSSMVALQRMGGVWISPEAALCRFEESRFSMGFSMFATLRALADYDSWENLWNEYGKREETAAL